MATLSEISAANNYQGSSAIGGSAQAAVNLDARPLESLAHYVFFYNRNLHEEKRKDADARAMELAELAKFNPDAALPQDKKAALEVWNRILAKGGDYARKPLTGSGKDNLQQLWDFKSDIASTVRLIEKINKRAVSYNAQKSVIDKDTNLSPGQKDVLLKKLDEYANTDTTVDIPTLPESALKMPDLPAAALQNWETTTNVGDAFVKTKVDFFDPSVQIKQAYAVTHGLDKLIARPDSEQYQKGSEREKLQYDLLAKSNNDFAFWRQLEDISQLKDAEGKVDMNKILSNPLLQPIYDQRDAFNKWSAQMREQAVKGVFTDHLGKPIRVVGLPADHFIQLPTDKPLNAGQMAMLDQWAKSPKLVTKEEEVRPTGYATQRRRDDLDYSIDKAKLKQADEQWKAAQTGGETVKNGALQRAKRIYDDLTKLADKQGIISPDKIRQLNVEQLKYLGTGDGALDLSEDEYAIQLVNGEIKVLAGAVPKENGVGYRGNYDNTKSTNIYNIGTNILNEELQKAGAKELNTYAPIDLGNLNAPVSENVFGGSTTQSRSVKGGVDPSLDTNLNNWEALPNGTWKYIDGSIYNSKGKKIK